MESVKKYMASQLKAARKKKGLSVDEVGEAVGKSGKTISAWEVGRGQPNGDELLTLCKLLEVRWVQVLFRTPWYSCKQPN